MSQQSVAPSAITSKLTALLRLGLVSKNNMARAITVFKNPEKAMSNTTNRMLMQELLVDIMDRIINNKTLYNIIRQNISKDPAVNESVSDERAKVLFRSGLVKKKDIMLARRAITNHNNLKSMSAVGVYREMMISMLDSMVKKITGNPILFNAFKRTLGTEQVEESFTFPNSESISEFFLDVDSLSLRETNKPTNAILWSQAKTLAKNRLPGSSSDCSEGWATKWYNENGGEWQSIEEGKKFFGFIDQLQEMAQTPNRRWEMKKHLSKPLNNWMKNLDAAERKDNEHLYGLGGTKVKFRTKKKPAHATTMKEWMEGESQKGFRKSPPWEAPPQITSSTLPKRIESQARARQNRKNRAIIRAKRRGKEIT